MKIYSIKRTFWYQDELTYEEDGRAKETLKKLEAAFENEEKQFGQIIEKIYDSGMVPDLFKIILKPYRPTFLHALWNAFWARFYRLDRTLIVNVMKNSEIAQVVSDFFLLNTSWIGNWKSSSDGFDGSLSPPRSLMGILFPLTRSSSSSPKESSTPASG